jgi:hypothetical protein
MKIVVFGLTISSSSGNGHATLWRGLCKALAARSHEVTFFERDVPYWGIIPAAGRGSRIQPLAFSKELLPVGSRVEAETIFRALPFIVDQMSGVRRVGTFNGYREAIRLLEAVKLLDRNDLVGAAE